MGKDILPIGTVVTLNQGSDIKFVIVGFWPTNKEGEQRDYAAIRYPMGVYDNRMYFFFNQEDIQLVVHKGYEDEEFYIMIETVNNWLELSRKAGDINESVEN